MAPQLPFVEQQASKSEFLITAIAELQLMKIAPPVSLVLQSWNWQFSMLIELSHSTIFLFVIVSPSIVIEDAFIGVSRNLLKDDLWKLMLNFGECVFKNEEKKEFAFTLSKSSLLFVYEAVFIKNGLLEIDEIERKETLKFIFLERFPTFF